MSPGYRSRAVVSLVAEELVAVAETPVWIGPIPKEFSRTDPFARFIRSPW